MRQLLLLLPILLLGCRRDDRPLLNGRVEAYLTDLGPRAGGRLVELSVREGQRVKAGDLLARVAAEELEAAVQRDQAGFDSADAKRLELDRGSRSEDIAQGEARVQDAAAALRLAEDSSGRWPVDCTLDVGRATGLLRTPLLGVDEVIGAGERGKNLDP